MKTLEELIAGIPTAPPKHERFRVVDEMLEFLGVDGVWCRLSFVLSACLVRPKDGLINAAWSRISSAWLRWLEDCANAGRVAFRDSGPAYDDDGKWLGADYNLIQSNRWANWLAAVKGAAKGEDDA